MKRLKWVAFFSILLLLPISAWASLDIMRVSLMEGDVQIRTEETGDWVPASINMPIKEGDHLWAAERSRLELNVKDGSYLRLDENSALEILTLDKNSYQVYLSTGRLFANYRGGEECLLQVDTPDSSIRAYEKAKFRVDVSDRGQTEVSTFRGAVYAESPDGKTRVDKGRTLYLTERGPAEFGPFPPPDEWEKWNRQRDTKLAEWRPPSKYLPEDLRPYSRELDDNGQWVYTEDYGYVWTPRVVVSAEWAPYRLGRWTWIGGDYVWVSYEPWGWVPYHYGRWAFVASFGWCWVPPVRGAVYWGPGYVGWVVTPTQVSWVPLAPREIYYGHGYYGPNSVNITKVNVTNIHVDKIVYRNVHVSNAVTVVHRDAFISGKHVDVRVRENPFLRERVRLGGPDIKPERTLRMPVVREIPQDRKPPEPIREIKVRELKEKRPFVREKEKSVLRPGVAPREMAVKVRPGTPEVRAMEKPGSVGPAKRDMEKPGGPKFGERVIEKPKEARPMERAAEPRPTDRGIQKPQAPQTVDRGVEKRSQPMEKALEKPSAPRAPEKVVEKPKDLKSIERGVQKPQAPQTVDRGVEKRSQPMGKALEKPSVPRASEKAVEKPKDLKPIERGIQKPQAPQTVDRGVEKRSQPTGKALEKPSVPRASEKIVEKSNPVRPAEKGMGKAVEPRIPQRPIEKSVTSSPQEKNVERGRAVEREVEKGNENRPADRGMGGREGKGR